MRAHGHAVVTPVDPPTDGLAPLIALRSGYVQRAADRLPRRGSTGPWRLTNSYPRDLLVLRLGPDRRPPPAVLRRRGVVGKATFRTLTP